MLERPERIPERFPLVQDPPFTLDDVRTFLFTLRCDPARIDALLAHTFAWAEPDITIRRLGSTCLLAFTDVARAGAANPMFGTFAYQEATWFLPVLVTQGASTSIAMHVPFIYPSHGLATAAGREIYGIPKKPGTIAIPPSNDVWNGVSPLTVRALAAAHLDGSAWVDHEVCKVESLPQSVGSKLENELLAAIDAVAGPMPAGLSSLLKQDLVQLKQVADVTTGGLPMRALYRAVTRVRAPVSAISNVRFADATRVTVRTATLASEPIAEALGLPPIVTPSFAGELTMSFRFEPGEVWKELPNQGAAPQRKTKVLILGGGMSALATAHALTDTEARRDRYDVHVLAQGHLLGGKGASTRDPSLAQRNMEHGIHVFFGFYHNALRLMRSVYAEASRPSTRFPDTFDDAFLPKKSVVFHDGTHHHTIDFPETPAGWGACDIGLAAELRWLRDLAEGFIGGSLKKFVSSSIFGTWGNPVVRDILLFTATLIEAVTADVIIGGKSWDDLDNQDFREWMKSHQLPFTPDITQAAIMQVPYDGVFAYEGPDQTKPRLSAGVAARGLLKLVATYEVAVYYAMSAGMGETVFAPLYEVLKARGVQIEMFSKVKGIKVDTGRVVSVTYAHQATVKAGPLAYDPLTVIHTAAGDIPTFHPMPDSGQLVLPSPIDGLDPYSDAVTAQVPGDTTLAVDTDFDWVVCGLPAPVTASVLSGHAGYADLARIKNIPTVATLHVQTWLADVAPALGWSYQADVLGGFPQPLNSMHLRDDYLNIETWPLPGSASKPRGLVYASGPFGPGWSADSTDPGVRTATQAAAETQARDWIQNQFWRALPVAQAGGQFDDATLFAPVSATDPIHDQYVRRNIDKSQRYVLMLPGGLADRPGAAPAAVSNLRLVGDWTKNGIDIPCIEGTVVSALRAAESILGEDLDILAV